MTTQSQDVRKNGENQVLDVASLETTQPTEVIVENDDRLEFKEEKEAKDVKAKKTPKKSAAKTIAKSKNAKSAKTAKGVKTPKAPKTPKAAKAAAAKLVPTSGQSGPAIILSVSDLNPKEKKVAETLNGDPSRKPYLLSDLAVAVWPSQPKVKANSWVRNSLRRLVRGGWVERAEKGTYQITEKGQANLPA
jgi:hypothetical protein